MRLYTVIETELGWVALMRSGRGLCASTLPLASFAAALQALAPAAGDRWVEPEDFGPGVQAVNDALAGRAQPGGLSLDLSSGTPFQQAVWRAVLTIPLGETRSYGWVAEEVGRPLGAHAVGQAVSRNPLPLFVPCHRVTAADGGLGGYGHGARALPTKRTLLRREGVHFSGPTLEQMRDSAVTTS
jgi:O-6-methylguanine DNA methyltransferase